MFRVLYRKLQHPIRTRELITIHVNVFGLRSISHVSESTNTSSITVDYLINSCGLPPETALSAAKKVRFCSTEKPDSVLTFFQNHGLTKTQITELISKLPSVLLSDPDKTLKPKIDFFHSLGVSGPNLGTLLASDATLLTRSLQNQMIPSFNFLKSLIGTNDNILTAFRRSTRILRHNLEQVMGPNIAILRSHGVPECNILKLLRSQPRTLMQKTDRFNYIVEAVKKMGFDPLSPMFVHATRAMAGMSQSSWEGKLAIYQNLGWSEDEILSMFKKAPLVMLVSEEKIRRGVEFFVKKLNWNRADITLRPSLLMLSLEKRIVPRCVVLEILNMEEMIRNTMHLSSVLKLAEKEFLEKYVIKHQERVPEVMKAFKGKIAFAGFGEVGGVKEL